MKRQSKIKENFTVFINDTNSRKGFDVVNIIKNKLKYPVRLASSKDYSFQLPLIYNSKIYQLRSDSLENFQEDILIIERKIKHNIIYVPVSENATRYFIQLKNSGVLSDRWKCILPDLQTFNLTSDKWLFQQFCESHDHPVPKSITPKNYQNLIENFRPVVLKPKSGQGSVGIKYFQTISDLPKSESIDWDKYLIQEKIISNKKVSGAFFFRHKNIIQNEYCHQRLRVFPPEGGVTVYSQSVVNREILEAGRKLLDDLEWQGLAMIEFMFDEPSQSWKIIELNPRLWGSVLLSAFNDSKMLENYIEACIGNEIEEVKAEGTKPVFIRWFFPFELIAFIKGNLKLKTLMKFDLKKTCYVNFTYANFLSRCLFLIYFTFNIGSISRFIKKLG